MEVDYTWFLTYKHLTPSWGRRAIPTWGEGGKGKREREDEERENDEREREKEEE